MSLFRTALATTARSAIATSSRSFHVSPATQKVAETVAEVNKGVGQALADAIDKGQEAARIVKKKTAEVSTNAEQRAKQTTDEARSAARESKDKIENQTQS